MKVHAAADGARRATYRLRYGIKKLEVRKGGIVMLNGRRLNLRGASIHEDDKDVGAALTPGVRRLLVGRLKDLGASVTRSHYPLHPQFLEAFDRQGILYWVDAPVYQLPNRFLDTVGVRTAATRAVRLTVMGNANNASVMTYSLINEPASSRGERGLLGAGASQYFKTASKQARELDPTKLIAIERQARVGEPLTFPAWRHLDVLGVNEYFGWYPSFRAGLTRPPTATQELGPYLDSLHRANPNLGLFITEFGAEGARNGPETQKGSLEFQRKWALEHLAIHRSKRWINGSIYWALRDFRVDPTWRGGARAAWTTPPWHNKSLIDETNARKPVYEAVKRQFRRTKPLR
jgi:beta-glucuronidase